MKKLLSTSMFLIAFICIGTSVSYAKNISHSKNSVKAAKKSVAKAIKAKCNGNMACGIHRSRLIIANAVYESSCAPNYDLGCSPKLEASLIQAANEYELCLYIYSAYSKNISNSKNSFNNQKSK